MIVDDVQSNLQLLAKMLKEAGYKVRSAIDGKLALMGIDSKHPDLILLDIKMPGMDGYEVAQRLKENNKTASIPIIFLSALGETQDKIRAFDSGGLDYITKPFESTEVLARVRTHLELYQIQNHLEEEVQLRTKQLNNAYSFLAKLEEQYRSIVASFDGGHFYYAIDINGFYSCYEPKEFLAHYTKYMTDNPINEQAKKITENIIEGKRQLPYQLEIQHKDGTFRWLEITAHDVIGDEYNVMKVEGIAHDITIRKISEEELRVQIRNNILILNSAGEGIFGLDTEGKHTFVNPAAASLLGYTEQELLNNHSHLLWHYEYPDGTPYPEEKCPIYKTLQTGEATSGEDSFIRKDGTHFFVTFTSQPIIENHKVIGAVVSFMDITEHKNVQNSYQKEQEKVHKALKQTIMAVASTVEKRDAYTAGHQSKVAELAAAIAIEMKLSEHVIEGIRLGGFIHDIGKIYIPAEILTFPGKIEKVQLDFIKTHPEVGYEIIKDVEFPWPVAEIIHQHHERMDGSGYPLGLMGEDITLEARIVAVADVVEAMASHRPYRASLGIDVALKEIEDGSGKIYDKKVVDCCIRLFREEGYTL